MQAIIMAAGRGSRLNQLTKDKPKAFLEIKGYRLIEYNIALLHSMGIKEITIITGYKSEVFEDFIRGREGLRCVYNPFYEFMNVLGSFFMGQEYLLDDDLIYMHADTLCAPEILYEMIKTDGDIVMPSEYKDCDDEAMKIRTENGKVVEVSKLIPNDRAEGEFIGVCFIKRKLLHEVKKSVKMLLRNRQFNSYFEGAIQDLIDQKKYDIIPISTGNYFWGEIDFKEDYQRVVEEIPDNLVEIVRKEKDN